MKASDALAELLAYKKVNYGFELIGGMIAHLVDSINLLKKTKLISVHHEQGAAFAAAGVARASNNAILGLALGTSGPGATNLVTGIADCWLDNVPCLFITGQVNMAESKGDKKIKQQGFQELDIIKIVESITKYAVKLNKVDELLPQINKAIDIALSGRQGPVLIDIPMNLQREEVDEKQLSDIIAMDDISSKMNPCYDDLYADIRAISQELLAAEKPLVLLGGGAVNNDLCQTFTTVLNALNIPHVASLKGCEKIAEDATYFGMIGSYGTRVSNYAIQNCDVLLAIGTRLDVRQTGADCQDFARNARIIQIDIDQHQLNNRIQTARALQIDARHFFQLFIDQMPKEKEATTWLAELQELKLAYYKNEYPEFSLSPFEIFRTVNEKCLHAKIHYVCDVGNNQMWAAHTLRLNKFQKMHHSGGLGAMGFCIPTSMGIQLATGLPVISFSGDGGAQLNIQELDVIARENLPILTVILNNKALGMVRSFQEMYFDGRDDSTYWKKYSCNFVHIAQGYNMDSQKIATLAEFAAALDAFLLKPRPMLIELDMESINECRPRLSFGDKLDQQSPRNK